MIIVVNGSGSVVAVNPFGCRAWALNDRAVTRAVAAGGAPDEHASYAMRTGAAQIGTSGTWFGITGSNLRYLIRRHRQKTPRYFSIASNPLRLGP